MYGIRWMIAAVRMIHTVFPVRNRITLSISCTTCSEPHLRTTHHDLAGSNEMVMDTVRMWWHNGCVLWISDGVLHAVWSCTGCCGGCSYSGTPPSLCCYEWSLHCSVWCTWYLSTCSYHQHHPDGDEQQWMECCCMASVQAMHGGVLQCMHYVYAM